MSWRIYAERTPEGWISYSIPPPATGRLHPKTLYSGDGTWAEEPDDDGQLIRILVWGNDPRADKRSRIDAARRAGRALHAKDKTAG